MTARPDWRNRSRLLRQGAAVLLGLAAAGAAGQARAEGPWGYRLTPYILASFVEGSADLGQAGPVSFDAGNILDHLQSGGMLEFEAVHASGFGARLRYSVWDAEAVAPDITGARYDQALAEAVLSYSFRQGRDRFELFGGVRHWDVDASAEGLAGAVQLNADWTEPVAGLRWLRRLSDRFSLSLEGDIGGFGGGRGESWSAMGGLIYDRWERASIYVMYRGIGVEYQEGLRGTSGFFRHDTVMHGLLAGVGLRF